MSNDKNPATPAAETPETPDAASTPSTPAATPAIVADEAQPATDPLASLDGELEELIAEEVTVDHAVRILLDAIKTERDIDAHDIAEINVNAEGTVRILSRGRVRRTMRVSPFVPEEDSE